MTKTEALRKARAKLAYGYYVDPGAAGRPYSYCPDCGERVEAWPHPWQKEGTRRRLLREALVEHLTEPDYCTSQGKGVTR